MPKQAKLVAVMEDDNKSITTVSTTITKIGITLKDKLAKEGKKVNMGSTSGIFYSSKVVDNMRAMLDNWAKEHEPSEEQQETLRNLYTQLTEAQASNQSLLAEKKELEDMLKKQASTTGGLKVDWEHTNHKNAQTILALQAESRLLRNDLTAAQNANKEASDKFLQVKHGFDPQVAIEAQKVLDSTRAQVTEVNNQLQARNSEISHLRAESAKAKQAWADAQTELEREKQSAAKLLNEYDAIKNGTEITLRPMPKDNSRIVRIFGKKGLRHINEFDGVVRGDVRDQCYKALSLLKSSNSQPFTGLADLVQLALDWVRTQSYKARQRLSSWVQLIVEDIRQGTVKRVAFYREELEKLIGLAKEKAAEIKQKAHKYYEYGSAKYDGFFDFLYHETKAWAQVFARRSKRIVVKAYHKAKAALNNLFFSPPQSGVVFDADDFDPITMVDKTLNGPWKIVGRKGKTPFPTAESVETNLDAK